MPVFANLLLAPNETIFEPPPDNTQFVGQPTWKLALQYGHYFYFLSQDRVLIPADIKLLSMSYLARNTLPYDKSKFSAINSLPLIPSVNPLIYGYRNPNTNVGVNEISEDERMLQTLANSGNTEAASFLDPFRYTAITNNRGHIVLVCTVRLNADELIDLANLGDYTDQLYKYPKILSTLNSFSADKGEYRWLFNMIVAFFWYRSVPHDRVEKTIKLGKWTNENYSRFIADTIAEDPNLGLILLPQYFRSQDIKIYPAIPVLTSDEINSFVSICESLKDEKVLLNEFISEIFSTSAGSTLISTMNQLFELTGILVTFPQTEKYLMPLKMGLKMLMRQEQRVCVPEDSSVKIDVDEVYLLDHTFMYNLLSNKLTTPIEAWDALNYYLGFDPELLDLEHAYLTGSTIPACFIRHPVINIMDQKDNINIYYPVSYNVYPSLITFMDNLNVWRGRVNKIKVTYSYHDFNVQQISRSHPDLKSNGVLSVTIPDETIGHSMIDESNKSIIYPEEELNNSRHGPDVDICVDERQGQIYFEGLVNSFVTRITEYFEAQGITLSIDSRTEKRASGSDMYVVEIRGMRTFQFYRGDMKQIMTHHVSMTRGFVTGNGENRKCYLSASCVLGAMKGKSTNYYYFAGKRSKVSDVILKYLHRGWGMPTKDRRVVKLMRGQSERKLFLFIELLPYAFFVNKLFNINSLPSYLKYLDYYRDGYLKVRGTIYPKTERWMLDEIIKEEPTVDIQESLNSANVTIPIVDTPTVIQAQDVDINGYPIGFTPSNFNEVLIPSRPLSSPGLLQSIGSPGGSPSLVQMVSAPLDARIPNRTIIPMTNQANLPPLNPPRAVRGFDPLSGRFISNGSPDISSGSGSYDSSSSPGSPSRFENVVTNNNNQQSFIGTPVSPDPTFMNPNVGNTSPVTTPYTPVSVRQTSPVRTRTAMSPIPLVIPVSQLSPVSQSSVPLSSMNSQIISPSRMISPTYVSPSRLSTPVVKASPTVVRPPSTNSPVVVRPPSTNNPIVVRPSSGAQSPVIVRSTDQSQTIVRSPSTNNPVVMRPPSTGTTTVVRPPSTNNPVVVRPPSTGTTRVVSSPRTVTPQVIRPTSSPQTQTTVVTPGTQIPTVVRQSPRQ